jgi:hypothetical protein
MGRVTHDLSTRRAANAVGGTPGRSPAVHRAPAISRRAAPNRHAHTPTHQVRPHPTSTSLVSDPEGREERHGFPARLEHRPHRTHPLRSISTPTLSRRGNQAQFEKSLTARVGSDQGTPCHPLRGGRSTVARPPRTSVNVDYPSERSTSVAATSHVGRRETPSGASGCHDDVTTSRKLADQTPANGSGRYWTRGPGVRRSEARFRM